MYPDHDGKTRFPREAARTSDVQVEALGFDLLQVLR